jgi:hypothetical protein
MVIGSLTELELADVQQPAIEVSRKKVQDFTPECVQYVCKRILSPLLQRNMELQALRGLRQSASPELLSRMDAEVHARMRLIEDMFYAVETLSLRTTD